MASNNNILRKAWMIIAILVIIGGVIATFVSTTADVKYVQRDTIKTEERSLKNEDRIVKNEKDIIAIHGRFDSMEASLERIEKVLGTK